ncbi:hypothetical protein GUJ93_ZPchr0008g11919 [Zizania palustris]|uniref:Uncharacterized protein n=1 Tax=Zizania palustris TaxID=103762 RepID=A0A8J5RMQ6_ZIZPA|nr:hypothetical protein GUJ93_ZPchr0008g11919 [Zizania palustris]
MVFAYADADADADRIRARAVAVAGTDAPILILAWRGTDARTEKRLGGGRCATATAVFFFLPRRELPDPVFDWRE